MYSAKLFLKKTTSIFYLNPLEKSKLKNYNFKNFKYRFDFFKNKISSFSKCELMKNGDIYMFKKSD